MNTSKPNYEIINLEDRIEREQKLLQFLHTHATIFDDQNSISIGVYGKTNPKLGYIAIYNPDQAMLIKIQQVFGASGWFRKSRDETNDWVKLIDDIDITLYSMEPITPMEVPPSAWPILLTDVTEMEVEG